MILLDANLLVYAHAASFGEHERARTWLDERIAGASPVGMPWESLLAFVRLVSNPRVFERPLAVAEAWAQVEGWLSCPTVWVPEPTERHRELLAGFLRGPGLRANHVPDAHLAAIAVGHGLVLCSTDADFARFEGLRFENPLR